MGRGAKLAANRFVVPGLLAFVIAPGFVDAACGADDAQQTIDFVINQLEASRQAITSLSYTEESDGQFYAGVLPGQPIRFHQTTHVVQDGANRRAERQRVDDFADGRKREYTQRGLSVDGMTVIWRVGLPKVDAWRYDPGVGASREAFESFESVIGGDLLISGYGTGLLKLSELRSRRPDADRWDIETVTVNGRETFHIHFYSDTPATGRYKDGTYVVDPDRGFLVTRSTLFTPDGRVRAKWLTTVERVGAEDVWMPVRIVCQLWRPTDDGKLALSFHNIRRIRDISINQPANGSAFQIAALKIPEGTSVHERQPDGRRVSLRYLGGQFVNQN